MNSGAVCLRLESGSCAGFDRNHVEDDLVGERAEIRGHEQNLVVLRTLWGTDFLNNDEGGDPELGQPLTVDDDG